MNGLEPADIQRALRTSRFGRSLAVFDAIASTNTEALERARDGAPEGHVVLADSQRQGRGRLKRQWVSPPGCNLYCSLIVRPALPVAQVPLLTLTAGLAAAETVATRVSEGVRIKWPNDVLIQGRKAAGILTEMETEGGRVAFAVVGIGVNLNATEAQFPPALRRLATSIAAATGRAVDRAAFCAELLNRLEDRYDLLLRHGFAAIAPLWQDWDALAGRRIEVRDGGRAVTGTARGLAADGRLRLEAADGAHDIVAGDVTVVAGAPAPGTA